MLFDLQMISMNIFEAVSCGDSGCKYSKAMVSPNVEVTLAMWVSIQDLKKHLNTEFSIGPKSVTIMIMGCQ